MEIEDSIMYDMSTWSIPLAYNLDAFWSENKIIANTTTCLLYTSDAADDC